jgi:hypothetical protein
LILAQEALTLFEERRPEIIVLPGDGFVIDGRRMETSRNGPLSRRGMLGAQAFLGNLVVVENCVKSLIKLETFPDHLKPKAKAALATIQALVDRNVRNTHEHIDERILERSGKSLISSSIFDDDFLCSTRRDGSIGAVAVNQATLDAVTNALDGIFWTPEELVRLSGLRRI